MGRISGRQRDDGISLTDRPRANMTTIEAARLGREGTVRLYPEGPRLRCEPGQTLLAAALAAGIDLPYECASGSCGSCKVRLLAGEVASLWPAAPGLSERDRSKGDRILCCQSIAQGDCVVQARPGSEPPPVRPSRRQARVQSVRRLNRDVMHLVLEAAEDVVFLPGQFVLFDLPNEIGRRAYSMANIPGSGVGLEFLIKRKSDGRAGAYLFESLRPGHSLTIEGPYGRAWLREDRADEGILLLAGGSGLAPVWSIARAALKFRPKRRVRLYFGVNSVDDLFWLDEIDAARQAAPNFEAHLVLMWASPRDPPGSRVGAVGSIMAEDLASDVTGDLYMAGPPGLIDSVLRDLVATGRVQADRVYFDRF
jgi:toluene monooxygenase electron transfer component